MVTIVLSFLCKEIDISILFILIHNHIFTYIVYKYIYIILYYKYINAVSKKLCSYNRRKMKNKPKNHKNNKMKRK